MHRCGENVFGSAVTAGGCVLCACLLRAVMCFACMCVLGALLALLSPWKRHRLKLSSTSIEFKCLWFVATCTLMHRSKQATRISTCATKQANAGPTSKQKQHQIGSANAQRNRCPLVLGHKRPAGGRRSMGEHFIPDTGCTQRGGQGGS